MMRGRGGGGGRGSVSFIAQTTGVSLIPCFVGSDEEMRGFFSPSSSSLSCLQDSSTLSRFLPILDKANVISTLQHMVRPSLQHACRHAHKGHFLNIFCSSYYKIHQKLKRQSRKALGEHETPEAGFTLQIQDGGDENLACFTIFIQNHISTYGGRKLGCPVCSWQAVVCDSLCSYSTRRAAATRPPFLSHLTWW